MSSGFRELADVQVSIDKVVYVPTLEAPADRPFPFVYFITIHNRSTETVFIRGRKWVVTDRQGCKIVVEEMVSSDNFLGLLRASSSLITVIT